MADAKLLGELLQAVAETKVTGAAATKAAIVVDVATISLLVDAKIVTVQEAIERIERIRDMILVGPKHEKAKELVLPVISTLQTQLPKVSPGWKPTVVPGGLDDQKDPLD